ncbi:MAG: hypothetical protein Q9220_004810 [cf. Caloplaca sp. 1 TL-2023]
MTVKVKGYGKRGQDSIALQLRRLHIASPKKHLELEDAPPIHQKSLTGFNTRDTSRVREPLGDVDANAVDLSKQLDVNVAPPTEPSKRPRTRKPKRKRKSLVPSNDHNIKTLELDDLLGRHLEPLLILHDVSSSVYEFDSWAETWCNLCHFEKIAQGSYGAVYRIESKAQPGTFTIGKLLPLKPRQSGRRNEHTPIQDAANEVLLTSTLDQVHGFVEFRKAEVLKGRLPDSLVAASAACDAKHADHLPARWKATCRAKTTLWLFIEMSDAGTDLETALINDLPGGSFLKTSRDGRICVSAYQIRDIFWQVASAVAVAEKKLEFEHRDLHLNNICLTLPPTASEGGGTELWTENPSLLVTIIDYTLSRAKPDPDNIVFNDLNQQKGLFHGEGHPQYEVYRQMKATVKEHGQNWGHFQPLSNVLWLNHLLVMLIEYAQEEDERGEETDLWEKLLLLKDRLGSLGPLQGFSDAQDVVRYCEGGVLDCDSKCN